MNESDKKQLASLLESYSNSISDYTLKAMINNILADLYLDLDNVNDQCHLTGLSSGFLVEGVPPLPSYQAAVLIIQNYTFKYFKKTDQWSFFKILFI